MIGLEMQATLNWVLFFVSILMTMTCSEEKAEPERDHSVIRVASISYTPKKWDKDTNMQQTEALIRKAAARPGVELIVLPEGVLEGYVVNEVDRASQDQKPKMEKEFLEVAEPIDGPYIQRYRSLAKELSVLLCVGFAERDGNDVYNTVVLIGRDGNLIGKYRKTHLAQGYGHPSFYKTGKEFPSFETPCGNIGMIICYDRQLPEPARLVRLAGAQIILVPSYGATGEWNDQLIRMRARENGVPMVFCHPKQSLFVDGDGHILANVTATNHIEVCDVPLPTEVTDRVSHRRPELYKGLFEVPRTPSGKSGKRGD